MATSGGTYDDEGAQRTPGTGYGTGAGGVGAPEYSGGGQMGGPYGGYGRGWGMGPGGGGWGMMGGRRSFPIETKPFFLTSEFFGVLVLIVAMAIGAASHEDFDSRMFWILATAVVSAYVISRGIAKSGTKSRAFDPREELFQREGRND